jgi:hypothetical protein
VAAFVEEHGFCLQAAEVPFYEYRIDLYGFSILRDETIAIELKLTNWRKAIAQAMLYQLCADLVYIALPEQVTKRVDLDQLNRNGIGLIAIDNAGCCSTIVPAGPHEELRRGHRDRQIDFLKGGGGD